MEDQLMNEAKYLARGTLDTSVTYMNLGFTLAAAMAWSHVAQVFVKQHVKMNTSSPVKAMMYPLVVTLLAVVVFQMSRRVSPNAKRAVVVPVVGA